MAFGDCMEADVRGLLIVAVLLASSMLNGCAKDEWTYAEVPDEQGSPGISIHTLAKDGHQVEGGSPKILFVCFPTQKRLLGFIATEPMQPSPDRSQLILVKLQYDDQEPRLDTLVANGKGRYPTALNINADNLRQMIKADELKIEYVAAVGAKRQLTFNVSGLARQLKKLEVGSCKEILDSVYSGGR